jgi:hypothetical protein
MSNETAKAALDRAANPARALREAVDEGKVKMTTVLAAVGLDAGNPTHQAALLACEKHLIVIPKAGPYITRDGWLHIAHRIMDSHGQPVFDGLEVLDEWDTDTHWCAKVAAWRKDMSHPFTYRGRYPHRGSNAQYGPEMAVKVAEVAALRRAFPVAGVGAWEERWEQAAPEPAWSEVTEAEPDDGTAES